MHRVFINLALVTLLSFATAFSGAAATRGASAAAPAAKAPEVLPAGALQDASSVYLRQAASQQVRWQPYRAETFAMAKRMNRPILIDIGAMWCHWCHVMDEQTYADPQVAALINQSFVPIKVDRDQRPDIDQYYQAAAAELSGNGGWPLTCFTMPDGALFAAFGFLPPTAAAPNHDSGMEAVLKEVVEDYKTRHKEVTAQAA